MNRDNFKDIDNMKRIYSDSRSLDDKYDVLKTSNKDRFVDFVFNIINIEGDEKVLDIGAGQGRFTIPFARLLKAKHGKIIALDISKGVMTPIEKVLIEEKLPIEFVVMNAETFDFPVETFDYVMANHMLYHIKKLSILLEKINEVLKKKGYLIATTNSEKGMPEFFQLHIKTMEKLNIKVNNVHDISFSSENGSKILSKVFKEVKHYSFDLGFEATDYRPILKYYKATQLFNLPYQNEKLSVQTRNKIEDTFSKIAMKKIQENGGTLYISKPVSVFIGAKK